MIDSPIHTVWKNKNWKWERFIPSATQGRPTFVKDAYYRIEIEDRLYQFSGELWIEENWDDVQSLGYWIGYHWGANRIPSCLAHFETTHQGILDGQHDRSEAFGGR